MKLGLLAAVAAYVLWGLLVVFWKTIDDVPAHEILCHRMVWSLLFTAAILGARGDVPPLVRATRRPRTALLFFGSGSIIALNWVTYIWAVQNGYIVEASLGYFINPLVTVFLGMVFLGEQLRRGQWVAIGIAAAGVLYLTFVYGSFPWISIILAITFGFYGLLRKTAPLEALPGLTLETAILFLPAAAYLLWVESSGGGSFIHSGWTTTTLLALSGAITALPLLLFAFAARRITLTTIGILHYIAPTLQFLLGVLVYGEAFTRTKLVGFCAVWTALAIYSIEGIVRGRMRDRGGSSHDERKPAGG